MQALRGRARQLRNRWIDQTLLRVERARAALEQGGDHLLLLSDSTCLSWAAHDTDRRLVPQLLAERTGLSVIELAGPGFNARMHDAIVRVLAGLERRPRAVVVSQAIRTNTMVHVREHPIYGYGRTREALARISGSQRKVRAVGRGGTVAGDKHDRAFRQLEVTTRWGGTQTIGAHLARLEGQGPPPWPVEVEQRRFDYFHGEEVTDDNPGLAELAALGRRVADYGVPAVAYWSQPPVEHGERLFPGEFATHVERNLAKVEAALCGPGSAFTSLVKPELEPEDYQDGRNGTEHYAFSGRMKIVDEVAASLELICS